MSNIFERATRQKLRFDTTIGDLTVEQVWDLPLIAKSEGKPDLDKLARAVNRQLKDRDEGSFVDIKPDPRKAELELKLEVLKHVIVTKQTELAAAEKAKATAEYKRRLLAAKASKEEQKLAQMSEAEIDAELAKLAALNG